MPVPARPEKLLEAMYGPAWQVPDPAFQFTTPDRTIRAFNDWFRGTQPGLRYWDRRSYADARRPLRPRPSPLARRAHRAATELGAEVLDVGAGRGADSLWLARRGHRVTAYDYVLRGLEPTAHLAAADGLHLDVRPLNLTEWRSVLAEGALLARRPGPKVVLASHLVDATSAPGREGLVRLCSMAMRDGGRLLADFHLLDPDDADVPDRLEWMVGRPDVEAFTTLVRDAGATEVDVRVVERGGRPTAEVVGAW
jgi:SAM-dependent methyltransferase